MGSIWVREFSGGLDARRLPETSPGGTLVRAIDGHINRGKEFEQRADMVEEFELPLGQSKGLARTPQGLVVFGNVTGVPDMPEGIGYQHLPHPEGHALALVRHWTLFKGKLLVAAEFTDGSSHLFYDGVRVSDTNAPPNAEGSEGPRAVLTHAQKALALAGPLMIASAVSDATDFGAGEGAGTMVHDMSTHADGAEDLVGLCRYDQYVAAFAENVILIWFIDPDPGLDRESQVLRNTGAVATRAITEFGDSDVFYLSRSGLRSLRARDSSTSASTTDIGSAIDPILLREVLEHCSDAQVSRAIGLIEPRDGRYWLIVRDRIFVFTHFQEAKVSAWSEYRPGFVVDDAVVHGRTVWLRSGDKLYSYGGTGQRMRYSSETQAEVWLPYLDADEPAREKEITGVDAALRGTWEIRAGYDPLRTDVSDKIATADDSTFANGRIDAHGYFHQASLRFKALAPESETSPAKLSTAILHYQPAGSEDS